MVPKAPDGGLRAWMKKDSGKSRVKVAVPHMRADMPMNSLPRKPVKLAAKVDGQHMKAVVPMNSLQKKQGKPAEKAVKPVPKAKAAKATKAAVKEAKAAEETKAAAAQETKAGEPVADPPSNMRAQANKATRTDKIDHSGERPNGRALRQSMRPTSLTGGRVLF